jgi:hypothetical protein
MRFNLIAELLSDNKKKIIIYNLTILKYYEKVLCNFGGDACCRDIYKL